MNVTSVVTSYLSTIRAQVKQLRAKGTICPCCDQVVKEYTRPINSSMALGLIELYNLSKVGGEYHNISTILSAVNKKTGTTGGREFFLLAYWKLVEEMPKQAYSSGKTSGYWKLLPKGRDFVLGKISIPRSIRTYNRQCIGFSEDLVTIDDALGERFNYDDFIRNQQ